MKLTDLKLPEGAKLKRIADDELTLNVLLHGPSGNGKTVGAGSFPNPVILNTEGGGWTSIEAVHGYRPFVWPIDVADDIRQAYKFLRDEEHPFETVILDSATEFIKVMLLEIIERNPGRRRASPRTPNRDDYGDVVSMAEELFRSFRDLPMHVVFTALSKTVTDDERGSVEQVVPSIVGQLNEKLPAMVDVVLYCSAMETEVEDGNGGARKEVVYVGQSKPLKGRIAKDRSNKLPLVTPTHYNAIAGAFGLELRDSFVSTYGEEAQKPAEAAKPATPGKPTARRTKAPQSPSQAAEQASAGDTMTEEELAAELAAAEATNEVPA